MAQFSGIWSSLFSVTDFWPVHGHAAQLLRFFGAHLTGWGTMSIYSSTEYVC